jgi:hypothetical protein
MSVLVDLDVRLTEFYEGRRDTHTAGFISYSDTRKD